MNSKKQWRIDLKSKIQNMDKGNITIIETKYFEELKNIVINKNIKTIACYVSNQYEININKFIIWALNNKYNIYLPQVNGTNLFFRKINNFYSLKLNVCFNILEPIDGAIASQFDLIIVPCLGYSLENHRLGYGKGFYDKFLSQNPNPTLGICWINNEVPTNLFELHDIKLNKILLL